jgi:hypothetical protein
MSASPGARPVARPFPFTLAIAGALLAQVKATPMIGWFAASKAVAVKAWDAPWTIVAVAGATVTLTTSTGGGGSPASLQLPNVLATGPLQDPAASRCSDWPSASVPASRTPMSVDVKPLAGPLVAAKVPSYERNSTTVLVASTSAIPSGSPFWIPFTGYVRTSTPRSPQVAGIVPFSVLVL